MNNKYRACLNLCRLINLYSGCLFGAFSLQEDAHLLDLNIDDKGTALFGVFDGHAGREVARYCASHMVSSASHMVSAQQVCHHLWHHCMAAKVATPQPT
jgi:hypothetical protein